MPYKPAAPCAYAGCLNTTTNKNRYCDKHQDQYRPHRMRGDDNRPNASQRGYGSEWRRIRARVLREYGIPQAEWRLYEVHHRPEYNPAIEPDHRCYELIPMLKAEHSRITGRAHSWGENPRLH
jgi:hypothetical protein